MKNKNENVDPTVVKKWLTILIAILSALAGALGESATSLVSNLKFF